MLDDQDVNKNTTDDTADKAAIPDVKTGPEEVTEATEEVQNTETVIEEPKIETPVEGEASSVKGEEETKENLSYDELPTDEPKEVASDKSQESADSENQVVVDESADPSQVTEEDTTDSSKKDDPNAKWYVVHTYSGHENKVASALKQRVESEHLEHKILDVLVPTQDKIEIKAGKKEQVKEKIFPGYILVKMVLDDGSWLAVRTTQGVTSFVGIGNKPTPIPEHEVKTIVRFMSQGATSTFKDVYQINDTIKIIDGPFSDFIGKVDTVDKEKGKVRVLVSIFGRETPVELDFLQVQKL